MSRHYLLLRHSCSAHNAYSPSVALCSTFFSPAQRIAHFSTSYSRSDESQAAAAGNDAQSSRDTGKLGVGHMFSNYEALKREFDNGVQPARSEREVDVAVPKRDDRRPHSRSGAEKEIKAAKEGIDYYNPRRRAPLLRRSGRKADSNAKRGPKQNSLDEETGIYLGPPPGEKIHTSGPSILRRETMYHTPRRSVSEWKEQMKKKAALAHSLSRPRREALDRSKIEHRRQLLDYYPLCIPLPPSPMKESMPLPWVINDIADPDRHALRHLSREIKSFARYVEPSPAERVSRDAIITEVQNYIGSVFRHEIVVDCTVFGSERTGLATATSDIDFRIAPKQTWEDFQPRELGPALRKVAAKMRSSEIYEDVQFRFAAFPIIAAKHRESGIDIQIVSAPDTGPQQNATARYLSEFPHLRSIFLVMKMALSTRGLTDVYTGGTGSYGLFIMLVASLKHSMSNDDMQVRRPLSAGAQLRIFLEFWSNLDTTAHGVSVDPPEFFPKYFEHETEVKANIEAAHDAGDHVRAAQCAIGQKRLYQPYLLCLQDPANPPNDLGRKSNAIKHVQKTLQILLSTLTWDMGKMNRSVAREEEDLAKWEDDVAKEENDVAKREDDVAKGEDDVAKGEDDLAEGEDDVGKWEDDLAKEEDDDLGEMPSLLEPMVGRCHEVYFERRRKVEEFGVKIMKERRRNRGKERWWRRD